MNRLLLPFVVLTVGGTFLLAGTTGSATVSQALTPKVEVTNDLVAGITSVAVPVGEATTSESGPVVPGVGVDTPKVETIPVPSGVTQVTPAPVTVCEIVHAVNPAPGGDFDYWAVYGHTFLGDGVTFTFTVTADGHSQVVPLTSKTSSILVNGVQYGTEYGGEVSGTFGNTTQDMPRFVGPHGPVTAIVTRDGVILCSA